ncbi:hypothetical protein [Paraflavitalea speifideaquila]|uniref:hypothetical protein n=1 Tax=Paraflavitalea speifideaquila TaxID=3076558 RepID=UPI0028E3D787|nr:hypothetical protein [Paraflavitalea speifideiaquila]
MSKTAALFIKTTNLDFNKYDEILDRLTSQGWSMNKNGAIVYMVEDTYEWIASPLNEINYIKNTVKQSINKNLATCIDMQFVDGLHNIGIMYIDPSTLMISISENIKLLENIPIADFSWYITKISSIYKTIDISSFECLYN